MYRTTSIREHSLSYNSFSHKCFWKTPSSDSGKLRAAERTHIDILSSINTKLKCVNNSNVSIGINNQMIATIDTPHSLITGPPDIIKFGKEGIAYTVIQNCASYSLWIERNDPLGFEVHNKEDQKVGQKICC